MTTKKVKLKNKDLQTFKFVLSVKENPAFKKQMTVIKKEVAKLNKIDPLIFI